MERILYRVGDVAEGKHSEDVISKWSLIDSYKPMEHPIGRLGCIYAAPDANGMSRWLMEAILMGDGKQIAVHKIIVNEDKVFLYDTRAYDRIYADNDRDLQKLTNLSKSYWDTGTTVTSWRKHNSTGWSAEALIPPSAIILSKKLSCRQVMKALDDIGLGHKDRKILGIRRKLLSS